MVTAGSIRLARYSPRARSATARSRVDASSPAVGRRQAAGQQHDRRGAQPLVEQPLLPRDQSLGPAALGLDELSGAQGGGHPLLDPLLLRFGAQFGEPFAGRQQQFVHVGLRGKVQFLAQRDHRFGVGRGQRVAVHDRGHAHDGRLVGEGRGVNGHQLAIALADDGHRREIAILLCGEHLLCLIGPLDVGEESDALLDVEAFDPSRGRGLAGRRGVRSAEGLVFVVDGQVGAVFVEGPHRASGGLGVDEERSVGAFDLSPGGQQDPLRDGIGGQRGRVQGRQLAGVAGAWNCRLTIVD